ncbi:kinase-like domain-containing protein [Penicillium cataractarum]|uniref:non-specific serine/threonine protein kinase n=1 Tax=Penicillium cataractarum TaxID=2100454 RepID=A0A9W9VTF5_9EURO|nr:kinase-like domain-containing protein [Penicillium cataractarum]KAJ5389008.1 kinase-like domain-containing protein [Penicillium cataractarum]
MVSKNVSSCAGSATLPFQYVPVEEVERIEKYQLGGYHPIMIGDSLQSRYQVAHKLGYGTYSTTWLCQDSQSAEFVAIKVGTAESSAREVHVLDYLSKCTPLDHPGRAMIPSVQDNFVLHGPNGNHPCYVTAIARCTRLLISQLVLAIDYIHSQGVVHGDLHIGNVFLRLPADFNQLSIEQLYEQFGSPAFEPVVRLDGQLLPSGIPSKVVPPIWLGKASELFTTSESRALLGDLGEAVQPSAEYRYSSHAPLSFLPPEARFEPELGLSFPADIWTLACCIWIKLGQRPLFEDTLATPDDITAEQVDTLGELPRQWQQKWEARHEYYDESGLPNQGRQVSSWGERLENHIQLQRLKALVPVFDSEEKAAAMNMLRLMLCFEPKKRWTAHDILKCEWMEKWALPDYEESRLNDRGGYADSL